MPPLLIVGASVRAAAQSAQRAGFTVAAVDLFADVDLQAIAPTWQVSPADYPEGLIAAARQASAGPWMYTGGLENYPEVVAAISEGRELHGVWAPFLSVLRDPHAMAHFFSRFTKSPSSTLGDPENRRQTPTSGDWLLKPWRSAGGLHIQRFSQPPYPAADELSYWSRFIAGTPQSAVYLVADGNVRCLGVTEQLSGTPWAGARDFAYAGNIGPIDLPCEVAEQYQQLGDELAGLNRLLGIGFAGLVGVDVILGDDRLLYPLELNPRYTASVEVLERALPIAPIAWHVAACRDELLPDYSWEPHGDCAAHGKVIVYAREAVTISERFVDWCQSENEHSGDWPALADLPHVGTQIETGQPVLTAFATGGCVESVRQELKRQVEKVYRLLRL